MIPIIAENTTAISVQPTENLNGKLIWLEITYAAAILLGVRMVAVAVALAGTHLGARLVAFLGWFGPRGRPSALYLVVALAMLGDAVDPIVAPVVLVIALSVVAHGVTAAPFSRWLDRRNHR